MSTPLERFGKETPVDWAWIDGPWCCTEFCDHALGWYYCELAPDLMTCPICDGGQGVPCSYHFL